MTSILLISLGAALWEELAFRGLLLWLTKKITTNKWLIITPQALIFSLMHIFVGGVNGQLLYSAGFGILFGYIVYRWGFKKGLAISILIHFLVNVMGLSYGVYIEGLTIEQILNQV